MYRHTAMPLEDRRWSSEGSTHSGRTEIEGIVSVRIGRGCPVQCTICTSCLACPACSCLLDLKICFCGASGLPSWEGVTRDRQDRAIRKCCVNPVILERRRREEEVLDRRACFYCEIGFNSGSKSPRRTWSTGGSAPRRTHGGSAERGSETAST